MYIVIQCSQLAREGEREERQREKKEIDRERDAGQTTERLSACMWRIWPGVSPC